MNTSSPKAELRALVQTLLLPEIEKLVDRLPDGLSDMRQAEQLIREGLSVIAGKLLEAWAGKAHVVVGRPECPDCRKPMRHCGYKISTVVTTVGDVPVRRPRWRCDPCGVETRPHDAFLKFGEHGISLALAQVVSRLGALLPFEQARSQLRADYGVSLSKQTVELVAEEAGALVLKAEDETRKAVMERREPLPESADPSLDPKRVDTVAVFADGTMLHAEGDWHEIRVAAAAAWSPAGELLLKSSRARFEGVDDFAWTLTLSAREAGIQLARQRAFVADGAHWLWKIADTHFPGSIQILDWYHLAEKVHQTAAGLFGSDDAEGKEWAAGHKNLLWNGGVQLVLTALEAQRAAGGPEQHVEALRVLIGYLENNRTRVDYPTYRGLGLPCGSGIVEGACKSLVQQRCKLSGMRNWRKESAQAVLRLRAALQQGNFDLIWERLAA